MVEGLVEGSDGGDGGFAPLAGAEIERVEVAKKRLK